MRLVAAIFFLIAVTSARAAEPLVSLDYSNASRIPNRYIQISIGDDGALAVATTSRGRKKVSRQIQLPAVALQELKKELEEVDWKKVSSDKVRGLDGTSVQLSYGRVSASLWSPDDDSEEREWGHIQRIIESIFGLSGLDRTGMPMIPTQKEARMAESSRKANTLWDLLIRPTIGLHFARFAIFILIALPIEIFCNRRSRRFAPSFSTICLQVLIGVSATAGSYFLYTTDFPPGERLLPPSWFYPAAVVALLLAVVTFSVGICSELRRHQRLTSALRGVIFSLTVFFAITALMTPIEINRALDKMETENQNPKDCR